MKAGGPAIRDAATVIVLRRDIAAPRVLMGQRGATAAFMPNKFVFPGGAVDPSDWTIPLASPLPAICAARLAKDCTPDLPHALVTAAIRELWEETGLIIGRPGLWQYPVPPDWTSFAARGYQPDPAALQFVFRAITPPGYPRRFDARFFVIDATHIAGDPDDFSAASEELSHLQWIPLHEARQFDLPFITQVVLAEIAAHGDHTTPPPSVPFFRDGDEETLRRHLGGESPLEARK